MRHLVYLLLVANLVYLGWNMFETRAVPPESTYYIPPLPDSVDRLVTLDERPGAEPDAGTDEAPDGVMQIEEITTQQPTAAGPAIVCQALGPFQALDELEKVAARLAEQGLQTQQRELDEKEVTGYWVFLPAMTGAEVQEVLVMLKEHGDKEYYVGKNNFISLGTFRNIDRAKRRLEQVRDMGLDAILRERYKSHSAWWLDIQSDGKAKEQLGALVEQRPGLQLVDLACY